MADPDGTLAGSLSSQILELPPSCVEFCPAFPSYFLVGTYSLQPETGGSQDADEALNNSEEAEDSQSARQKQPQSRNGSIIAFKVSDPLM
jgi:diphthamide biosynthesis protein 7